MTTRRSVCECVGVCQGSTYRQAAVKRQSLEVIPPLQVSAHGTSVLQRFTHLRSPEGGREEGEGGRTEGESQQRAPRVRYRSQFPPFFSTFHTGSESRRRQQAPTCPQLLLSALLLFFLTHFFQFLFRRPLSQRSDRDRRAGSWRSFLGVTPPSDPTPKLRPFCFSRPLQTELGTSLTWPD